jgi:predicted Zn-dependent protease
LGKALIAPKVRSTYAIVYYDAVQAAAKRQGVITEPDLVGYVMAHEIGHLLGANHNVNTIMKGSVVSRDMDALYKREPRFSRQERDGIRSEVLARLRSVSRDLPVASEQ